MRHYRTHFTGSTGYALMGIVVSPSKSFTSSNSIPKFYSDSKKFAEEYLPASIVHRKKIGFATPASKWYTTHKQLIEEIICSNKEMGKIFNLNAIREVLNTHEQNQNGEKQILLLLSLSLLME